MNIRFWGVIGFAKCLTGLTGILEFLLTWSQKFLPNSRMESTPFDLSAIFGFFFFLFFFLEQLTLLLYFPSISLKFGGCCLFVFPRYLFCFCWFFQKRISWNDEVSCICFFVTFYHAWSVFLGHILISLLVFFFLLFLRKNGLFVPSSCSFQVPHVELIIRTNTY